MATRTSSLFLAVIALGTAVALPSCGLPSRSSERGDLIGVWHSSTQPQMSISFSAEGVLEAVSWPENLGCLAIQGQDASDAVRANRLDLSGSWSAGIVSSAPSFDIRFDSPKCVRGSFPVYIVRQSGDLTLCVDVPEDKDPDSMIEADVIFFAKNTEGSVSDSKACLR